MLDSSQNSEGLNLSTSVADSAAPLPTYGNDVFEVTRDGGPPGSSEDINDGTLPPVPPGDESNISSLEFCDDIPGAPNLGFYFAAMWTAPK